MLMRPLLLLMRTGRMDAQNGVSKGSKHEVVCSIRSPRLCRRIQTLAPLCVLDKGQVFPRLLVKSLLRRPKAMMPGIRAVTGHVAQWNNEFTFRQTRGDRPT